jgi:hypothetical protein
VLQSWLAWAADGASLVFLLLLLGLTGAGWAGGVATRPPGQKVWLASAAVCAAGWSCYALAFWPGLMTVDSMNQWGQMKAWTLNNGHPAFHTLLNWLFTRVWESPAMVVMAQIAGLSLAFGLAMQELARWGVPRWGLALVSLLFALSPVNGAMVITLWKDIPYTIAFLLLTALLLRLGRTRGAALGSWGFVAAMVAVLTPVALLRHNGVPVAVLTAAALVVLAPRPLRRRALVLTAGVVGLFVLITGPVYKLIGVQPVNRAAAHGNLIHQVGAIVHAEPRTLSPGETQLLESIQPLSIWRDAYSCYLINPQLHNPVLRASFFDAPEQRAAFQGLWLSLVKEHWPVLVGHLTCVSTMVWRVRPPPDGYLYRFSLDMEPNAFGLKQQPLWPRGRELLGELLRATERPEYWWVWGSALYLYVGLGCFALVALRLRSAWVLLAAGPVLLHSLVLLALSVAQDFRYQYPAYVVGLVGLALLLTPRPEARPEEAA